MRTRRVLILLVAAAVMIGMFASCATTTEEITVKLIITAGDEEILNSDFTLNYKDPTVLMLVNEAAVLYELDVTLNEDGDSVLNIGEYEDKTVDNIMYFWEYYINGVLPENSTGGKANAQTIKNGDTIQYVYSSFDMNSVKS